MQCKTGGAQLDAASKSLAMVEQGNKATSECFGTLREEMLKASLKKSLHENPFLAQLLHDRRVLLSQNKALLKITERYEEGIKKMMDEAVILTDKQNEMQSLIEEVEKKNMLVRKLQDCLAEEENVKKKMRKNILELKGNIRVFCRVRPLPRMDEEVFSFSTSVGGQDCISGIDNGKEFNVCFDKVFKPNASQEDVFAEITDIVESVLDGQKVSILAYRQTGSGKTYTMLGRIESVEDKGLIPPRAMEKIFQIREVRQAQGWNYVIQVTFSAIELYQDVIHDMLSVSGSDASTNTGKQCS